MKFWNRTISLATISFTLLTLAANGQEYTENSCNPCCQPSQDTCSNSCENVDIGIDFLWWKPCVNDLDIASTSVLTVQLNPVESSVNTNLNYKTIDTKWEAGVRAYAVMRDACCDWSLIGSYTYIRPIDRRHVKKAVNEGLYNLLTDSNDSSNYTRIRGEWKARYQTFDAIAAYPFDLRCCHRLSPYFGLTGLFLDQGLRTDSLALVSTTDNGPDVIGTELATTRWDSRAWGLGLKFGTSYEYGLNNGIKLVGNAAAMLVAGDTNDHTLSAYHVPGLSTVYNYRYNNHRTCHCMSGWHLQISALYETCYCNHDLFFRIGYEFVQWYNVPNHRTFFYNGNIIYEPRSTSPSTGHLGFNGLFAAIGAKF